MTNHNDNDKDMLKRLERLQRQVGSAPEKSEGRPKTLAEAEKALEDVQRAGRVFNEAASAWETVSRPVKWAWGYAKPTYEIGKHAVVKTGEALSFLAPVARPLWNGYKALFNRAAYTPDETGARTVLNKPRALAAVALSLVAAWGGVMHGLPFTGYLAYDGVMMAATTEHGKEVFLTGANPYDNSDDMFYVKGCEELPCTDSNSQLYRIRDNTILSAYRLVTTGRPFWPEDVGAAIPEETSACTISTYGVRLRMLGMYPHITSVQCTPIAGMPSNPVPAPAPVM